MNLGKVAMLLRGALSAAHTTRRRTWCFANQVPRWSLGKQLRSSFVASEAVDFLKAASGPEKVGDYSPLTSATMDSRRYDTLKSLEAETNVWIRGRVKSIRAKGNSFFMVLRALGDPSVTVQGCYFKEKDDPDASKAMLKWLGELSVESVVDIHGDVVPAKVKSCSREDIEVQIGKCFVVARAPKTLPFLVEDAGRSDAEITATKDSDRPLAGVPQDARFDYRWLDLRTPANGAIMKLRAAICTAFRSALDKRGFIEIQSPKLLAGESESGAGVFTTDYFGQEACLAQSPQLYKQMAIAGDLDRVYEIAPVFRAENSNTRRHLCEFTGLDFEMGITENYVEAVRVGFAAFQEIFDYLESHCKKELDIVRSQFPSEKPNIPSDPIIIPFSEAVQFLKEDGLIVDGDDLTTAQEIRLGEIVKASFEGHPDFFVVDKYPTSARPFYTMPAYPDTPEVSNSYDFFLRGQEICSGAQRVHDPSLLKAQLRSKGLDPDAASGSLAAYLTAFDHGVPPHAGCGFGLDRVLFLYLNLQNIRAASLFPRAPNRLAP